MNKATSFCPPEHFGRVDNPERGYYSILHYIVGDDPEKTVDDAFFDPSDVLVLAEINLCRFTEGGISGEGVGCVQRFFERMRGTGKQLIVRFLYDWDGNNPVCEPRKIETVLLHISQIAPVIKQNSDIVYTVQGLLIGRWGEMHGSRFLRSDYLKRLYAAMKEVVGEDVTISLRTPKQWRAVTGCLPDKRAGYSFEAGRGLPGLFNDGIMGSISDLGTYLESAEDREKELAFQDSLCRTVPNGGEVVSGGGFLDPAEQVKILSRMHVSYLNRDHDRKLLDGWKDTPVNLPGTPEGTTLFDHVGLRLGYRFVITGVSVRHCAFAKKIKAAVTLKNAGFAPIYLETAPEIVIAGGDRTSAFTMSGGDLRTLCGSAEEDRLTYTVSIPSGDFPAGEYEIFFRICCEKYDRPVDTANDGCTEKGCLVGRFIKK